MACFEITVHHDVAISDISPDFFEVKENCSLFRRIFRYRLNDSFNLHQCRFYNIIIL